MIFGLIKFEENKNLPQLKNPVRCWNCFYQIEEKSAKCGFCGVLRVYSQPKTWLERFKRWLGIEISSDLIVLSINEPETFFTSDEIDDLLDVKKINVLDLEDVPNWNLMFYNTRRIGRPGKRRVPINRQLADSRSEPKMFGWRQERKQLARK